MVEFCCLLACRKRAGQIDGPIEHYVLTEFATADKTQAEAAQALGLTAHRFY